MRRLPSEPKYLMEKRLQRNANKILKRRTIIALIEIAIIFLFLIILFFKSNPFIDNFKYRTNGINCEFQCPDFDYGNAILFESSGENVLIDSGNGNHGEELCEYLNVKNIGNIDYLFIAETDEDYLKTLDMLIDSVNVETIVLSLTDNDSEQGSFEDYIATIPCNSRYAIKGMSFRIGKSTFDIIDPESMLFKVSFGENEFLVYNVDNEISGSVSDFDADILMKNDGSAIEVIDEKTNENLRTDLNGDIIIKSNEVDIKIECEKQ